VTKGETTDWKQFLGVEKGAVLESSYAVKRIIKRDGKIEDYSRERILEALEKAIVAVTGKEDLTLADQLTNNVEEKLILFMNERHPNSIPALEEIQDLVETVLIESKRVDLAKAYILYRAKREAVRDAQKLMLDINETMDGYLSQADWRVNENANVNFSLGGLILHNSGTITANYWLRNIYSEGVAEAHKSGAMHIHDLSMFSGYCAGWSIRQLISEGLGGVSEKITSKPGGSPVYPCFSDSQFPGNYAE
jgi:anaerobic ribonucleoside-triphosphate reductase